MTKLRREKFGKSIYGNGEYNILYDAEGTDLLIESRRRAIPHANGVGHWMHTTYFLIDGDQETKYQLLCLAKAAAQELEDARRQA